MPSSAKRTGPTVEVRVLHYAFVDCFQQGMAEGGVMLVKKENEKGRIAVPLILWLCGVPLGFVFILWFFFFRGH